MVAFSQGIIALADLSIFYLYKDDYNLTPAQMAIATGIVQIPWILKPAMGLITDTIEFYGFRRKSYLILFSLIQFTCWNVLAFGNLKKNLAICIFFTIQFSIAFNNVIGEALLVELSQKKTRIFGLNQEEQQKEAGKNVALFSGVKNVGTLITCYMGGYLLEIISKYQVFRITSLFSFILFITALFMKEKNYESTNQQFIQQEDNSQQQQREQHLKIVFDFLKKPSIYKPILFVFFFALTPSSQSAMFYFYTNDLGFTSNFLGQLKFFYASSSILAMLLYNYYLKMIPFKTQFIATTLLATVLGYTQVLLVTRYNIALGIPDKLFCLGDSIVLQLIGELNILPVLVVACRMCPKNVEGTMYSIIMSTLNLGSLISSQLGALLLYFLSITQTEFTNLWISIIITNTVGAIPLILINKIDFENIFTQQNHENYQIDQVISNKQQSKYGSIEDKCDYKREIYISNLQKSENNEKDQLINRSHLSEQFNNLNNSFYENNDSLSFMNTSISDIKKFF